MSARRSDVQHRFFQVQVASCHGADIARSTPQSPIIIHGAWHGSVGERRARIYQDPRRERGERIAGCQGLGSARDRRKEIVGAVSALRNSITCNGDKAMNHSGTCFCGAVELEVTGSPEAMGYCHCRSCRSWSGAPVNAFSLWKPAAVRIKSGSEHVATFQKTDVSQRQYCAKCGGHLMNNHPTLGLVDVFAATIPTLAFTPGVHLNYTETVLPMRDGLPKLRDFPAELGGSGQAIAE
jgi:hypothetical protein